MIENNTKRYNDYSTYIKNNFSERIQKISIDTGFTCPNRDGSKGIGGCTYCNNNSFSPNYTKQIKSISSQLEKGIAFFSKKYKSQRYFAYFQSYTNTYTDFEYLKELFTEAISYPNVIGLVIGTRPDCINESIIDFLQELSKKYFIALEFGIESTLNKTLNIINRCHTYEETQQAYDMAKNKGLHLGAHMILGLPGETRDDLLNHAKKVSELPIETLKLHHLQIIKNTMMAKQYKENPKFFNLFTADSYIDLVTDFISLLRPDIIIERFISEAPKHLLIAPQWNGLKNFEITSKIDKMLIHKNTWQGKLYKE